MFAISIETSNSERRIIVCTGYIPGADPGKFLLYRSPRTRHLEVMCYWYCGVTLYDLAFVLFLFLSLYLYLCSSFPPFFLALENIALRYMLYF